MALAGIRIMTRMHSGQCAWAQWMIVVPYSFSPQEAGACRKHIENL